MLEFFYTSILLKVGVMVIYHDQSLKQIWLFQSSKHWQNKYTCRLSTGIHSEQVMGAMRRIWWVGGGRRLELQLGHAPRTLSSLGQLPSVGIRKEEEKQLRGQDTQAVPVHTQHLEGGHLQSDWSPLTLQPCSSHSVRHAPGLTVPMSLGTPALFPFPDHSHFLCSICQCILHIWTF